MSMKDLRKAAADTTQAAAERGAELVGEAISRIQPLVEQAGEKVGPVAHDAKVKTADFASKTLESWQPAINDALDKVTPAVDAARQKVQDDLLPKLTDLLHEVAEHPVVQSLPEPIRPKKRSKAKTVFKVVAIGAILAGAIAAIKSFLGSKDDGWTAHEPSRAYVNTTDNFATAQAEAKQEEAAVEEMIDEGAPVETPDAATVAEEVSAVEEAEASEVAEKSHGEGSFVGANPPEGFYIKGNERSMKYHLPGTGGFERTIPDVWFNSEEAADAAGFTRAQR